MAVDTFKAIACVVNVPVPREWFDAHVERRKLTVSELDTRQALVKLLAWGIEIKCQETSSGNSKGVMPSAAEIYATANTEKVVSGRQSGGLVKVFRDWQLAGSRNAVGIKPQGAGKAAGGEVVVWLGPHNVVIKAGYTELGTLCLCIVERWAHTELGTLCLCIVESSMFVQAPLPKRRASSG